MSKISTGFPFKITSSISSVLAVQSIPLIRTTPCSFLLLIVSFTIAVCPINRSILVFFVFPLTCFSAIGLVKRTKTVLLTMKITNCKKIETSLYAAIPAKMHPNAYQICVSHKFHNDEKQDSDSPQDHKCMIRRC